MKKKLFALPLMASALTITSCNGRHILKEVNKSKFDEVYATIKSNQYDNSAFVTLRNERTSFIASETINAERKINNVTVEKRVTSKKCNNYIDVKNKTAVMSTLDDEINSRMDLDTFIAAKDSKFYRLCHNKVTGEKIRSEVFTNISKKMVEDFPTGMYLQLMQLSLKTDKTIDGSYLDVDNFVKKAGSYKHDIYFDITGKSYIEGKTSITNIYSPLFDEGEIKYGSNDDKSCSITMKKTLSFEKYYSTLIDESIDNYSFEGNVDVDIFVCLENNFLTQLETKVDYKNAKRINKVDDKETTSYFMNAHNKISFNQDSGKEIKVNVDDYHETYKR